MTLACRLRPGQGGPLHNSPEESDDSHAGGRGGPRPGLPGHRVARAERQLSGGHVHPGAGAARGGRAGLRTQRPGQFAGRRHVRPGRDPGQRHRRPVLRDHGGRRAEPDRRAGRRIGPGGRREAGRRLQHRRLPRAGTDLPHPAPAPARRGGGPHRRCPGGPVPPGGHGREAGEARGRGDQDRLLRAAPAARHRRRHRLTGLRQPGRRAAAHGAPAGAGPPADRLRRRPVGAHHDPAPPGGPPRGDGGGGAVRRRGGPHRARPVRPALRVRRDTGTSGPRDRGDGGGRRERHGGPGRLRGGPGPRAPHP